MTTLREEFEAFKTRNFPIWKRDEFLLSLCERVIAENERMRGKIREAIDYHEGIPHFEDCAAKLCEYDECDCPVDSNDPDEKNHVPICDCCKEIQPLLEAALTGPTGPDEKEEVTK